MKNAISNVWLIGMVFVFILLFAAYLAVSVSYSRAFKVKNEMLTIIEKHDGMTNKTGKKIKSKITSGNVTGNFGAIQTINLFLMGSAYRTMGSCPTDYYGIDSLTYKNKITLKKADKKKKYYYCFKKENMGANYANASYYDVRIFYKFNLPVLGDIFTFNIDGRTSQISFPQDEI